MFRKERRDGSLDAAAIPKPPEFIELTFRSLQPDGSAMNTHLIIAQSFQYFWEAAEIRPFTLLTLPMDTPAAMAIWARTSILSASVKVDEPLIWPPSRWFERTRALNHGSSSGRTGAIRDNSLQALTLAMACFRHLAG
jgi:hypothetical protein